MDIVFKLIHPPGICFLSLLQCRSLVLEILVLVQEGGDLKRP